MQEGGYEKVEGRKQKAGLCSLQGRASVVYLWAMWKQLEFDFGDMNTGSGDMTAGSGDMTLDSMDIATDSMAMSAGSGDMKVKTVLKSFTPSSTNTTL